MKRTILTLVLFSLAELSFAQAEVNAPRLAAVALENGVPELVPGHSMNSDLAHTRYAMLEERVDSYTLYFLQGEREGRMTYWTVLHRADGTLTLSNLSVMPTADGVLVDTTALDIDLSTSARAPLEIRLPVAGNAVMYRWLSAGSGQADAESAPVEQPVGRIEEGAPAPDFTVRMLDGEVLRLRDLAGRIIVVNWWATTCAPCLAEMPGLNELVQEHGSRDDLLFLAIAYDTEADLRSFLSERAFLYRHGLGDESLISTFGGAFPRNVIIDSTGRVVYDRLGANENQYREIWAALEEHGLPGE